MSYFVAGKEIKSLEWISINSDGADHCSKCKSNNIQKRIRYHVFKEQYHLLRACGEVPEECIYKIEYEWTCRDCDFVRSKKI